MPTRLLIKRFVLWLVIGICILPLLAIPDSNVEYVHIGVFVLFHPQILIFHPATGHQFVFTDSTGKIKLTAVPEDGLEIQLAGERLRVIMNGTQQEASDVQIRPVNSKEEDFDLTIPNKIHRRFQGTLDIKVEQNSLSPVVVMELETAVASVVAAEAQPGTPIEGLKAQAVATRSYLIAGKGRHTSFDFCDSTHCQFLRSIPASGSKAQRAVQETRGQVIVYKDVTLAAMFSASCGGRTRTLLENGMKVDENAYPYYSVICKRCQRSPEHWNVRLSKQQADVLMEHPTEKERLKVAHELSWSNLPSNDFKIHSENGTFIAVGKGHGHGMGLCQRGAAAMAASGNDYRMILEHYYPNTSISTIQVH